MAKKRVAILGLGKIGQLVAFLLARSGDYSLALVDSSEINLKNITSILNKESLLVPEFNKSYVTHAMNFQDYDGLCALLRNNDYVVSCAPFFCNALIARAALATKTHYLDLTEDVKTTEEIVSFCQLDPSVTFIPQCGLAPGFVTLAARYLMEDFDAVHKVHMRVGALPLYPNNSLKYNLTWSTDGLINEYCNPCEVIVDGQLQLTRPLEGYEVFDWDGVEYEAFHTSGGVGSFAKRLVGTAREVNYKTLRYPGHCNIMNTLLYDLGLVDDRDTLKRVLESSLPYTQQDVSVVFVTITGMMAGRLEQKTYAKKIYAQSLGSVHWGAIQLTTASSVCAVLDLHATGGLFSQQGLILQEDIPFQAFLKNRFGKIFDDAS